MMRIILRANGAMEAVYTKLTIEEIEKELGADALDTVSLPNNIVMLVDDEGHRKNLAFNEDATQMYWAKCGGEVDHVIRGDVYICPDWDFE
jgi:hypothetical protein